MSEFAKYFRPEVLSKISRLELRARHVVEGFVSGMHKSPYKGYSVEFANHRPYVPGDDPRHIDWAVTARTNEPHVRDTIADHELEVWLVLDTSSSLGFGTGRATKHEMAWSAAGAFALLASSGGNRVGAVRSTPEGARPRPQLIPARGGSTHAGAVLAALHRAPVDGEAGDLSGAIDLIRRMARRRGMAIVVSDFLGAATWERPLRALSHRHEVIAVEVIDPREVDLPDVGLIAVVDPETGRRRLVDTSDAAVRVGYGELASRRRAELATRLATCGADHMTLRTDRDWVLDFVRFVSGRKARLMAAGRSR